MLGVYRKYREYQVGFLHRTVRDFLMTKDIHDLLRNRTSVNFDARVSLCKLSLAHLKVAFNGTRFPKSEDLGIVLWQAEETLFYAHAIEMHNKTLEYVLLDELDRCIQTWVSLQRSKASERRGYTGLGFFDDYDSHKMVSMAAQNRVCLYVAHRLDRQPELMTKMENRALLLEIT